MPAPAVRRLVLAGAPALLACALVSAPAAALPQAPALPHTGAAAAATVGGSVPGPESRGPAARAGDTQLRLDPVSWVSEGRAPSLLEPERVALAGVGVVLAGLVGAFGVGLSRRPEPVD